MKEPGKVCCVTGPRQIPVEKRDWLRLRLVKEIELAATEGYTVFLSGFGKGVDLLFAACVDECKQFHEKMFLEAAIPYANRIFTKERDFRRLLHRCDGVKIVCEEYTADCMCQRNRYMVDQADRIIAVYDGSQRGDTVYIMSYAKLQQKEVRMIAI